MGKMPIDTKLFILIIFICAVLPNTLQAAQSRGKLTDAIATGAPAAIEADTLQYDKKNSVITALGNVEVVQGDIILLADKVVYNQKTNVVAAKGNISLMESSGNVFFSDKLELNDSLKKGIIYNFSARFSDESLIAANRAYRENEQVTVLEKVVYSPCSLCVDDPTSPPTWQVKAGKATIDEQEQSVKYNHAFFEVKGVPVLYTPYLSHPTPNAERKTGFLTPKYSTDKIFGTTLQTPFYYNIAPNRDMTISPTLTSNEGIILSSEYRHILASGKYTLLSSITDPDKVDESGNTVSGNKIRGHIEGDGEFHLNDKWSWGFIGKRATDDTYLRRYNFGDEDVLASRLYATAIADKNYFNIETLSFQGLKADDDPGKTPVILPNANIHWESQPNQQGAKWIADANLLVLARDEGISTNRLSVKGAWNMPHITNGGHVLALNTSLRGDVYIVDEVPVDPTDPINSRKLDGVANRLLPEMELNWSLPVVKQTGNRQIFIEPTAKFIASPYGSNPNKIPNEDSQDIEFSDENIFDSNHFAGYDRVESGPRVNYGVRGKIHDPTHGDISFLLGQNYRAKENKDFRAVSGLNSHFSDFVGRIGYEKNDLFDIAYKYRLDSQSYSLNRNAITANIKIQPVKITLDYLSVDDAFDDASTNNGGNRELMLASTSLDISKDVTLSGNGHRNLETGEWISTKADLLYQGDCIDIGLSWFKEFTRDRDIRPNTTLSLQFSLKNLGY